MTRRCARCNKPAEFAMELPAGATRWSMWCSQACLIEWEVDRLPNRALMATRRQDRAMAG